MNKKKTRDKGSSKCGILLRSVPGIIDGKKDCTDVWDMDTALHHHMYERDKYYRFLADVSDEVSPQEDFWYNYENWWNNYACDCTIISAYDLVSKKTVGCCIARSMYDRTHYYIETVYLLPEYRGQGVVTKFLEAVRTICLSSKIPCLRISSSVFNTGVSDIYEHLGFKSHVYEFSSFIPEVKIDKTSKYKIVPGNGTDIFRIPAKIGHLRKKFTPTERNLIDKTLNYEQVWNYFTLCDERDQLCRFYYSIGPTDRDGFIFRLKGMSCKSNKKVSFLEIVRPLFWDFIRTKYPSVKLAYATSLSKDTDTLSKITDLGFEHSNVHGLMNVVF